MIDVVFNDSFAVTLKHYYQQKGMDHKVLSMPMYLSLGDISQRAFIESRKTVYKIAYAHNNKSENLTATAVHNLAMAIGDLKDTIGKKDSIRIWWSNNADDYCGFLWLCDFLMAFDVPTTSIHVPMIFPTLDNGLITISELGEINASNIDEFHLFHFESQLPKHRRDGYHDYWVGLRSENNPVRTIINGLAVSQSIDFYDRFVLANLSRQRFRDLTRVILETVGSYPFVPAWWYRHRIDYLVSKGSVDFKAADQSMVEPQVGKIKLHI